MSVPTVHEAELLERFENPEQDPHTGVWRERVSGYREGSVFGTKVPSAAGREGDQLGIRPGSPLPFVVEIGVGKERELLPEVDLSKMDPAVVDATIRKHRGDPVAAFRELARIMQDPEVIEDTGSDVQAPQQRVASPARPAASPAQALRRKPAESIEARVRRLRLELASVESELNAKSAAPAIQQEAEPIRAQQRHEVQQAPEPAPRASVASPDVQVEFVLPQGGAITTFYHEVIVQPGLVTFVYDTRFKFGTRYTPPVVEDMINAVITGQQTVQVQLLSAGIRFQHGAYEYTVMPVNTEAQE